MLALVEKKIQRATRNRDWLWGAVGAGKKKNRSHLMQMITEAVRGKNY